MKQVFAMAEPTIVAMSGGVDSSVAAAILRDKGYNVIGIGLKLIDGGISEPQTGSCCGIRDMEDARRVARQLSIPFYVLDFRRLFKENVIDHFVQAYLTGETPNPCIPCNAIVKFEVLWHFCMSVGASSLATGHYTRVIFNKRRKRYVLMKGVDESKDQSYFLYSLSQAQLAHACFPLGEMTKEETRSLARRIGLKVHDKVESQDICFVGDGGYGAFIRERAKERIKPGPILDESGRVVGEHDGLPFYTVGQRRGIGISRSERIYVSDIDPKSNTITITASKDDLKQRRTLLDDVNYVSVNCPDRPLEVSARTRYRGSEKPALLLPIAKEKAILEWHEPQEAPAVGQSVVFYDGNEVVGGGIVASSRYWTR